MSITYHTVNVKAKIYEDLEKLRKKWGERSIAATIGRLVTEQDQK